MDKRGSHNRGERETKRRKSRSRGGATLKAAHVNVELKVGVGVAKEEANLTAAGETGRDETLHGRCERRLCYI